MPFLPDDFEAPLTLRTSLFVLRPLGAEHNERDHEAWMSSIEQIKATPGYAERSWPRPMTLEENARDIRQHSEDFASRSGFTYTVLDPGERDVIGCVYIYPGAGPGTARVRSWVRATHAGLDRTLYDEVQRWLEAEWPFTSFGYATRDDG